MRLFFVVRVTPNVVKKNDKEFENLKESFFFQFYLRSFDHLL